MLGNEITSQMDYNIEMLESRIMDCLDHSDFEDIFAKLQSLDQATIFVGSGGSSVVTKFISAVINEKNAIISEPKLPDEVWVSKISCYRNMVVVSSGGMNYGAQKAAEKALSEGLNVQIMSSNNNITKDGNIKYTKTIKSEDSFISFSETLIPMVIALAYYIGDVKKTKEFVSEVFKRVKNTPIDYPIANNYEIVGKDRFPTATAFVESTMNESGIAIPTISSTYDELHGRTTAILQQEDREMIYLLPVQKTEIDDFLHERLSEYGLENRITDVPAIYNDCILDDFYFTLQMVQLCVLIAHKKGIDLSKMTNSEGKRVHLLANQDAITIWEAEHPGQNFWDVCDFAGLRKNNFEGQEKSPGFYAPTGKFAKVDFGPTGRGRS